MGSEGGKPKQVGATSSVLQGCGLVSSRYSWGCASMSTLHAHTTPSVEQDIMLFAFCVPMMSTQYTGCVCPPELAPVKRVFCTG